MDRRIRRLAAEHEARHLRGPAEQTVRGQIDEPCSSGCDGLSNTCHLVSAEVVHHHDVPRLQRRHQVVDDPAKEEFAVDRSIHDQGRRQARGAKGRQEHRGFPVAVRHTGQKPLPPQGSSSWASHVRLGPRFVDQDETFRIQMRLFPTRLFPSLRNVRTIPFRGDEDFFLRVRRSRCNAMHNVGTDRSVPSSLFSSSRVRSGLRLMTSLIGSANAAQSGTRRRFRDGAVLLSSRRSCLICRTQDSLTSKHVATSRVLRPMSHAASTCMPA